MILARDLLERCKFCKWTMNTCLNVEHPLPHCKKHLIGKGYTVNRSRSTLLRLAFLENHEAYDYVNQEKPWNWLEIGKLWNEMSTSLKAKLSLAPRHPISLEGRQENPRGTSKQAAVLPTLVKDNVTKKALPVISKYLQIKSTRFRFLFVGGLNAHRNVLYARMHTALLERWQTYAIKVYGETSHLMSIHPFFFPLWSAMSA